MEGLFIHLREVAQLYHPSGRSGPDGSGREIGGPVDGDIADVIPISRGRE